MSLPITVFKLIIIARRLRFLLCFYFTLILECVLLFNRSTTIKWIEKTRGSVLRWTILLRDNVLQRIVWSPVRRETCTAALQSTLHSLSAEGTSELFIEGFSKSLILIKQQNSGGIIGCRVFVLFWEYCMQKISSTLSQTEKLESCFWKRCSLFYANTVIIYFYTCSIIKLWLHIWTSLGACWFLKHFWHFPDRICFSCCFKAK